MMAKKTLFIDIGGVLMTNGWDTASRQKGAQKFDYSFDDFESRHRLAFSTYEMGRLTLDQYLDITLFYTTRNFSKEEFKQFMFEQSKPFPDVIDFVHKFKEKHNLHVIAISNEGKELIEYRITTGKLKSAVDFFVISGLVERAKPDPSIYTLALELAQAKATDSAYIDDRQAFVDFAHTLGFKSFRHQDLVQTSQWLERWISS